MALITHLNAISPADTIIACIDESYSTDIFIVKKLQAFWVYWLLRFTQWNNSCKALANNSGWRCIPVFVLNDPNGLSMSSKYLQLRRGDQIHIVAISSTDRNWYPVGIPLHLIDGLHRYSSFTGGNTIHYSNFFTWTALCLSIGYVVVPLSDN